MGLAFKPHSYYRRSGLNSSLKPYWGKPNIRNFRGGAGNRVWLRYCDTPRGNGEKQGIQTSTCSHCASALLGPLILCIPLYYVSPYYVSRKREFVNQIPRSSRRTRLFAPFAFFVVIS